MGLGVTLMMGRSGYITEFLATYAGLENTNWLYGFQEFGLHKYLPLPLCLL